MERPAEDEAREDRIDNKVVVDCYNEEERAMGWYCYIEENATFPFQARCFVKRPTSPLKVGDAVNVEGLASEDDCASEVMVLIEWHNDSLAVPLRQLEPSPASTELTRQAVADWLYWVIRGYQF